MADVLTEKQAKFVHYMAINGGVQRDAALRAGYTATTADAEASRLVRLPKVAEAINSKRADIGDETVATPREITERLWKLGRTAQPDSTKVQALRTLADIMGLTQGQQAGSLPEGLGNFLSAVAESMKSARSELPGARTVEAREIAAEPVDQQTEQPTE